MKGDLYRRYAVNSDEPGMSVHIADIILISVMGSFIGILLDSLRLAKSVIRSVTSSLRP